MSESSAPWRPLVIVPYGTTRTTASEHMSPICCRRPAGESGAGLTFGMAQTAVYPPLAAAIVPVCIVSL